MKKLRLFRKFDGRLAAELKRQRRTIVKGLLCVVVTSLLTTATIPLIRWSLQSINDAGQLGEQSIFSKDDIADLARQTGKSEFEAARAVSAVQTRRSSQLTEPEVKELARELKAPEGVVQAAVSKVQHKARRKPQTPAEALKMLGIVCLSVIGVYLLKYGFTRGQTYYLSYAAQRLANDLRLRMFAKLQKLPVSYFHERRAGAVQSVLTNDVNVYQNAVSVIRDSIDAPIRAIGSFAYILYLQWQLGLVAVLFIPVLAYVIQRNARKMRKAQSQVQLDLAHVNAMTQESLQGTRIVKAFNAEDRVQSSYKKLVEQSFSSQMGAVRRIAAQRPLVELIGAVALATVLYICGWLAYAGSLEVADIAALVFALDVINQGARSLSNVNSTYAQVQAASDRIYSEILDVPDEHINSPGSKVIENPHGRIEFKNVSFRYPDGTPALRNVDFIIETGTSLALVGPSGAGKSTIADLVLRFYDPTEGSITFDGVDLRELRVDWLRSQIGVVPQHTFLFAGSVADNIRMGAPDATYDEVAEAGAMAHAEDFVSRLPNRYNAELGELGAGLSGGERQRIAIARALVRKPTMLLLDEATSALDATSEKAVTAALEEVMHSRTTLFIAHRLTTAARADRILYLRQGQVVESGSHKELMEGQGEYAALFRVFSNGLLEVIQ